MLREVERVKRKLYGDQESNLSLLILLSLLLQEEVTIPRVAHLLEDN